MTVAAGAAAALSAALARAGYDAERIAAALGVDPPANGTAAAADAARLGDGPLATLTRLFLSGEPVAEADAAAALPGEALAEAQREGLLELRDGLVSAPVALVEWEGRYLVHDHEHDGAQRPDHVMGIGNATRTLAALTVRRQVARALDLGTGCGAQAFLLAGHADAVVATDVNPRALELARVGAALNGLDSVELRAGSFFEPVAGERFDVIATNPPFVVSPDSDYVFRDAGLARDDVSRLVVSQLPAHLVPGGHASTLVSWVHAAAEDWAEPVRRWLAGLGCDAIVVRYVGEDALEYATRWAGPEAADRWLAHYQEAGLERFATGGVVLRLRADDREPLFLALDADTAPSGPAGAQLERILAAHDFADDLLHERLALAPHRLDETLAWTGEGYAPERLVLRLDEGLGVEPPVDPAALPALFRLDGSRPLRELPDAERALPTIRRLHALGFLELR